MNAISRLLLVLGAVASALSGCLSQPKVWDCSSASDCNDDEKCLPSYGCVGKNDCRTEFDCRADEICRSAPPWDSLGVCTWVQCKDATACGAYSCTSNHTCNTACSTQASCAPGYACDSGACLPEQCQDDDSCEGYLCSEGWCNTSCAPERCAAGYQCENHECLLIECSVVADSACGEYTCDGFKCLKTCTEDDHCKAGHSCSDGSCEPSGRGLPCETAVDCGDSAYPVCDVAGSLTCGKPCESRGCNEGLGCDACSAGGDYQCGESDKCEHKCKGRQCGFYLDANCGACETDQYCNSENQCQHRCGGTYGACPAEHSCLNGLCY